MHTKVNPNSINQRVLKAVLELGECTTFQVLARVGRYIPAAMAANRIRIQMRSEEKKREKKFGPRTIPSRAYRPPEDRGKRRIVTNNLYNLFKHGKIRWVRPGVYAPPLPKIFEEGQVQAG